MKILIADDDRVTAQLLSARLRKQGHETIVAFDTMQTMMMCQRNRPELLILDVQMPGGSGLQVLHRIKTAAKTATLPVLVLTAHAENEQPALAKGADAFLLKPPDLGQIQAVLERFERSSRPRSEAPRLTLAHRLRAPKPRPAAGEKELADMPVPPDSRVVRNILVVEDDHVTANLVAFGLQRARFATIFANDVPDALRVLNAFRIDGVILDLQLPTGNGLDVIQRLRSFSRTGQIPILVVSGSADEHGAEFALAAGADRFFRKPADVEAVIAALREFYPAPGDDDRQDGVHQLRLVKGAAG